MAAATEEQKTESRPELRFKEGDRVKAELFGYWEVGTIASVWYREQSWKPDHPTAPYRIKLDHGTYITVPQDTEAFIVRHITKVPVTILTGFLGAGKTTLLNHILSVNHGKKIGIIENEFGAVSIDDKLLKQGQKRSSEEVVIEMKNGCICCTVRADLTTALKDMLEGGRQFDSIIIETTGMADPAPVIQTFCVDEFASKHTELDACITVVDAKHIVSHIDDKEYQAGPDGKEPEFENESVEQIAFADRILLNKIDLVEPQDIEPIKGRIQEINKTVEIIPCTLKDKLTVDLDKILGIKAFDIDAILKMEPTFLTDDGADHVHNPNVNSFCMNYPGHVDLKKFNFWVNEIIAGHQQDIFRMKGIVAVQGFHEKFVFQGVHMIFKIVPSEYWGVNEKRESTLVFIGRRMKELEQKFRQEFEKCLVKGEAQGDAPMAGEIEQPAA